MCGPMQFHYVSQCNLLYVWRTEDLTMDTDVTPCHLVDRCRRFRLTCCLPFQGESILSGIWKGYVSPQQRKLAARVHLIASQSTVIFVFCVCTIHSVMFIVLNDYKIL